MADKDGTKKNTVLNKVGYWALLNLGVLFLALSAYLFDTPNHFIMGGVTGLSIFISSYTSQFGLSQPYVAAILNVILLILGFIFLGKGVTFKTVFCSVMYAVEVILLNLIGEIEYPLSSMPMLDLLCSVILVGAGCAIIYQSGASSGGTDVLALIMKKFTGVPISYAVMISDLLITCLDFIPPYGSWELGLMCLLGLLLRSVVIEMVISYAIKGRSVTIITNNPDVVSDIILNEIHRGFTRQDGVGGYTGEPRTVVITVCSRSQAIKLKMKLREADPTAFVIITDTHEIMGNGFSERM